MSLALARIPHGWNIHTGRKQSYCSDLRLVRDPLPNFFLVGAMKSGTTAIYDGLRSHPDVFCSPIKEPNFFCDDIIPERFAPEFKPSHSFDAEAYVSGPMDQYVHNAYVRDARTYTRMFRWAQRERVVGDFSTSYLYSATAAANIRETVPNARVLIVLRNPVERAVSHYLMDVRIGIADKPLGELVAKELRAQRRGWCITNEYVGLGLYANQVKRYLMSFPRQRVKVVMYDDLRQNFRKTTEDICRFLDIDPLPQATVGARRNPARASRFPHLNTWLYRYGLKNAVSRYVPRRLIGLGKRYYYSERIGATVSAEEREWLRSLFAEDVRELSRLMHLDLGAWTMPAAPPGGRRRRSVA